MAGWQAPRSDDWPFVRCRLSAGWVPAARDRIERRRLRSQRTFRGSGSAGVAGPARPDVQPRQDPELLRRNSAGATPAHNVFRALQDGDHPATRLAHFVLPVQESTVEVAPEQATVLGRSGSTVSAASLPTSSCHHLLRLRQMMALPPYSRWGCSPVRVLPAQRSGLGAGRGLTR